jgi:hypothetical protein
MGSGFSMQPKVCATSHFVETGLWLASLLSEKGPRAGV